MAINEENEKRSGGTMIDDFIIVRCITPPYSGADNTVVVTLRKSTNACSDNNNDNELHFISQYVCETRQI